MTAAVPKYRLFIATNFWSLFGAGVLLLGDLAIATFVLSILVCPIWFLVSVIKNMIARTEWRTFLFRAATPALILGITLANTTMQWNMAEANGERIVTACESFHADNGRYPKTLDELVPRYLPYVPPAKYSVDGAFQYYTSRDSDDSRDLEAPILWWNELGPLRKIYIFDGNRKGWHQFD